MSNKFAHNNIHDAGAHEKNPQGRRYRATGVTGVLAERTKGSKRPGKKGLLEKVPWGNIEEFVDLQGNFVWIQVNKPGRPVTAEDRNAVRSKMELRGFIRAAACPVMVDDEFAEKYSELFKPEQFKSCGKIEKMCHCYHVDVIAASRQADYEGPIMERRAARNAEKNAKMAIEERKAAASEALTQRIGDALEAIAGTTKGKKPKDLIDG